MGKPMVYQPVPAENPKAVHAMHQPGRGLTPREHVLCRVLLIVREDSCGSKHGGVCMDKRIAECINILGSFCGKRDVTELTAAKLKREYQLEQADVMVLFGGSILCGGDVLAAAMKNGVAKKYVIVGGVGHTTETLRIKVHTEIPDIVTSGLAEAEVFEAYLQYRFGLHADFLECKSTNCGNNITNLLDLLKEKNITFRSIILAQDATMQLRMEAGMRKYATDAEIINFATYKTNVIIHEGKLAYENDILGMWDMERYITLLMGEIPRLSDDSNGYGPKGKNYIAHVEIPQEVEMAFSQLKEIYGNRIRKANPLYATTKLREEKI